MSNVKVFLMILTYVLVVSIGISYVSIGMERNDVSRINLDIGQSTITSNNLNYTEESNTNYTIYDSTKFKQYNDIGLVQIGLPLIGDYEYVYLYGIETYNGSYDNTYRINNTIGATPRYIIQGTKNFLDNEILEETSTGYYLLSLTGIDQSLNYNHDINGIYETELIYNPTSGTLTIYNEGEKVGTMKNIPIRSALTIGNVYYGGVGSDKIGFTIEKINTYLAGSASGNTIFDSLYASISNNYLFQIISMTTMIIVWTVPEYYLPLIINLIMIKTAVAALILIIYEEIRGST